MTEQFSGDKSDLDTIAKAIGLVVIQWAQAEQSLDMVVALLWQSFGGEAHARKLPVMLEPKIRFVRVCVTANSDLAEFRADAESLLAEFERLSSLRHDLIHGAVSSIAPIDGHFVFAKLDVRENVHHVREVKVPVTSYPMIMRNLVDLARNTLELVAALFERVKAKDGER